MKINILRPTDPKKVEFAFESQGDKDMDHIFRSKLDAVARRFTGVKYKTYPRGPWIMVEFSSDRPLTMATVKALGGALVEKFPVKPKIDQNQNKTSPKKGQGRKRTKVR